MIALAAAQSCTLVACPNPMQPAERVFAHVPVGQTLAEMIGADASHSLSIEMGGHEIPREMWGKVRPKPGQAIHATNYPQGGNAGKYVRIVAAAVLYYYTAGAGATWAAGLASSTGISAGVFYTAAFIAGSLALTPMIGEAREVAA